MLKPEIMPRVMRLTLWHCVLFVVMVAILFVLVGTIIATKAPCSWRPAWRPACYDHAPAARKVGR